jgi:hypothetical protein
MALKAHAIAGSADSLGACQRPVVIAHAWLATTGAVTHACVVPVERLGSGVEDEVQVN